MSLTTGTRIGPYEITSPLGEGGMGVVYRAHDTKLGRDVAIKALPDAFANDSDRLQRFQREAQVLASLNHPNIAHIYGLEESDKTRCIVMELVEGETLQERIKRGPIPIEDALPIARQIAEALEAAHEKGIIHRDLKPGNVMLTQDGKVKVLDFGLAKAIESRHIPATLSNSPTVMTMPETNGALILGTPAYMSPEQIRGKEADRRTDIWALACISYELLTGEPAFAGHGMVETIGNVLKIEPDWSALPNNTPASIVALLRRCLRKDVQQRPKDAGDLKIEIDEAYATLSAAAPHFMGQHSTVVSPRSLLLALFICLAASALTGVLVWRLRPAPIRPVERFAIELPRDQTLRRDASEMVAISPDGKRLVYAAEKNGGGSRLYLRAMDALESVPLMGTEGAYSFFFSPDSQWVGFFAGSALKKISLGGGAVITLCAIPGTGLGGAWSPDNTIVFATAAFRRLMKVSADGGEPQPFTKLQSDDVFHGFPQFLPDGKSVLFSVMSNVDPKIAVQTVDTAEYAVLIRGGFYGRYLTTRHLLYIRADTFTTMMAVPFRAERLALTGDPTPVLDGLMQFSSSATGSLAYVSGSAQAVGGQNLVWVDRRGRAESLPAPVRFYRAPRVSPDGSKVSVIIGTDIWIYDLPRATLTRFTFDGSVLATSAAAWTPDGKRLVFSYGKGGGTTNLFWKAADGGGSEERLGTSPLSQQVGSVSPDGRTLIYTSIDAKTGRDLWVMPLDGDRKPRVFLQSPFSESSGQISPDGHWVAYSSDESGRLEVYVRPYPGSGGKSLVSTDGGSEVTWSPKGNELFYRTGAQKEKMMAVDVQTNPTFTAGKPHLLFEGAYLANGVGATSSGAGAFYSVSADGQRFLMLKNPDQPQAALTRINVVLNWFEELKQRVPAH